MAAASKPQESPKKRGRKPLGGAARKRVLQIRLTEAEFSQIARMGGSAWARDILLHAITR
jgi:hypothetical protein